MSNRNNEILDQQKTLIDKSKSNISDLKEEYYRLLDLLDFKDNNLVELKKEIASQKENIRTLEEKLLSILVLEHKIKNINGDYQKEIDQLKQKLELTSSTKINFDKAENIRKAENAMKFKKQIEAEKKAKNNLEIVKEKKENFFKNNLRIKDEIIQGLNQYLVDVKEKLVDYKKENYYIKENLIK